MGGLEGYSGETWASGTTVDWRACATECSKSSTCKGWQFYNSNCMMVPGYQRTKALDGKGNLLVTKQMIFKFFAPLPPPLCR